MKVQKLTKNKIDRFKPLTSELTPLDFHKISHTILENTTPDSISDYGKFSCQFDFVHDFKDPSIEYDKPTHAKTKTIKDNALDMRLASMSNFREKGSGIDKVRRTLRQRNIDTRWLDDAKDWFKSEIKARITNRKAPMYYTSGIKHKKTTDYLDRAICMIIETSTVTTLFVSIGEVRYQFDFAVEQFDTKKESQLRTQHTISAYDIDYESDEDFDFDFDDDIEEECNAELAKKLVQPQRIAVTSSCELRYNVELKNTYEALDEELESVLASLDDEYELMMIEEDAKKRRLESLHYKGVC
ncbi:MULTISPECIES: hypothetical protein [Vibrio]|uniref:hypothetical protein n=1 Tax=Vibrio TaxID=662 RepID=UPI001BD4C4CF|nr:MULTISPECIES: hypothetical protein [Vibrio]EIO3704328.1 hypothetical protein [Vibrio parahaemolyticus]EIV8506756.1 hypothetical protein [Vibrio parahaemolyticus]ELA9872604.1 hypothetical protein [Vibrio parahaemolyticus]MBE4032481.1 hypothetical protein [Vibrio parahaemolyticus]MBS9879933.1 hypothetical protein [Vibrio alginolyticus]